MKFLRIKAAMFGLALSLCAGGVAADSGWVSPDPLFQKLNSLLTKMNVAKAQNPKMNSGDYFKMLKEQGELSAAVVQATEAGGANKGKVAQAAYEALLSKIDGLDGRVAAAAGEAVASSAQ